MKKNKPAAEQSNNDSPKTPAETLHDFGRLGLTITKALELLKSKLPAAEHARLAQALKNPNSPEMQQYSGGVAAGETEIAQALHTGVTDMEKDGYKNMDAERRHKAVSDAIRKNFGIGDEEEE